MTDLRVLVDENTSPQVAARLQADGYTAAHVTEVLDFGVSDQEIVAYATEHGYGILTNDDDFLRSDHTGVPILYYADDTLPTETLVNRIETLIDYAPSADDFPPVTHLSSWD